MVENIKIELKKYSSLSKTEIDIDKLSIIKGLNNSDLFKLLFTYLITLSYEGLFAASIGFRSQLSFALERTSSPLSIKFMNDFNKFIDDNKWDEYNISLDYLNKKYSQYKKLLRKHNVKIDSSKIDQYLLLFDENKAYRLAVLQHMIEVEFKKQDMNFKKNSKFNLFIDGMESLMRIEKKEMQVGFSTQIDILPGNVLYLSSTPIADYAFNSSDMPYHYEELYSNMTETHVKCDVDLADIMGEIEDICNGKFRVSDGFFYFISKDSGEMQMYNLSKGYKQLGVLYLLLDGYALPENSIMILDRIDDDMDSDLQKKTAEIIIKLAKKLDLLLLINTNNDGFFNAINQYSDEISIKSYEKSRNRLKEIKQ